MPRIRPARTRDTRPGPPPQPAPPREPGDDDQPCARGDWCTGPGTVTRWRDGIRTVEPERGPRTFCETDRAEIRDALAGLPDKHLELQAELTEPATGRRHQEGKLTVAPLPIREDVDALMVLLVDVLSSWNDRVADLPSSGAWRVTETNPRTRYRYGHKILTDAVDQLTPRLTALLSLEPRPMDRTVPSAALMSDALPDDTTVVRVLGDLAVVRRRLGGAAAGLEILALHYRCLQTLGETKARPEDLDGVACYQCHQVSLCRADPPDRPGDVEWYSRCKRGSCGHRMTEAQYRVHVTRLAAAAGGRKIITPALE